MIDSSLKEWVLRWRVRICAESYSTMRAVNPAVIPRNHNIEQIIAEFEKIGDSLLLSDFFEAISKPYTYSKEHQRWYEPPNDGDKNYQTFCGT